jgi:hypothetical protein
LFVLETHTLQKIRSNNPILQCCSKIHLTSSRTVPSLMWMTTCQFFHCT